MKNNATWNVRMLEFMEYCIYYKVKSRSGKVPKNQGDFLNIIGFDSPGNFKQVEKGARGFRLHHILNCSIQFNADANFFFDEKPAGMFKGKKLTPLQQLKAAAKLIEISIKK